MSAVRPLPKMSQTALKRGAMSGPMVGMHRSSWRIATSCRGSPDTGAQSGAAGKSAAVVNRPAGLPTAGLDGLAISMRTPALIVSRSMVQESCA